MKLPKLNEKLIAKVLKHITEEPKRYDQNIVAIQKGTAAVEYNTLKNSHFPSCGTKACFGGWAVLLSAPNWKKLFREDGREGFSLGVARELLGLTDMEGDFLFDVTSSADVKKDLKIIRARLEYIRKSRELFEISKSIDEQPEQFFDYNEFTD
jgi:hypothetical protein